MLLATLSSKSLIYILHNNPDIIQDNFLFRRPGSALFTIVYVSIHSVNINLITSVIICNKRTILVIKSALLSDCYMRPSRYNFQSSSVNNQQILKFTCNSNISS